MTALGAQRAVHQPDLPMSGTFKRDGEALRNVIVLRFSIRRGATRIAGAGCVTMWRALW
jgi:hypothetical protein